MDEDTIVPAKRLKTVLEAFRDTNAGKPLQTGKLKLRAHILAKSNELRPLETLAVNIQNTKAEIRLEVVGSSRKPSLVAVKKEKAALSDDVPFDDVRLVVNASGGYQLFVYHFDLVRSGTIEINQLEQLRHLVNEVVENCPCVGVDCEIVDEVGYMSAELKERSLPWRRVFSRICTRLVKIDDTPVANGVECQRQCRSCHRVQVRLAERLNHREALSPEDVKKRQSSSSKVPISYLSPNSRSKRLKNVRESRKNLSIMVRKYRRKCSVVLPGSQNTELEMLVTRVSSTPKGREEFEKCVTDAESFKPGTGALLREIWHRDKDDFLKDQGKNVSGSRSNRWTQASWRVALAIYARCPVLFDDLKKLDILQLPCRRSLERVMGAKTVDEGINEQHLLEQATLFSAFKKNKVLSGRPEPLGVGELLFDETKVQSRIQIRCTDGVAIGYAMSQNDWSCLHDVYETLDSSDSNTAKKANYVLQTYWRDMTSGFEFAGPYFLREVPLDGKFLHDILFQVVSVLEKFLFHVVLLVGDGASCNLALFKRLCGYANSQLLRVDTGDDPYTFKASFINPFSARPDKTCFVMICPAHQLKNVIAALYSSRSGGTKAFEKGGVALGWQPIVDQYNRDQHRVALGIGRRVPGLRYSYVERDCWTRLNVMPAKIMQQRYMIAALNEYASEQPQPADTATVTETAKFLHACNLTFEKGVLSHAFISSENSSILKNVKSGWQYFVEWAEEHHNTDYTDNSKRARSLKFLAWQTFDLQRVMVYCFLQFSKYFFENFPGYSLSPLRMSISRLESLFGSLKFQAHGNLSAGNYGSSLGRVQVRRELDLTSRALSLDQMFYRDEEALVSGTTHISNTAASDHHLPNYLPIPAHYVPYGFNGVKEFIFPLHISQSTIQGRNGSSACTLIALAMGQKFYSRMFEEPQKILDRMWFLDVVHSISQGNNIFDAFFPTGQLLDVQDVLEAVGVELQLASYEEPTDIFLRGNDFSELVKHVRDRAHLKRKSVGVIVCCQRSVALLVWENGSCAIFDSHQHLGYGCVLCHSLPTKEDELCFWLGKTFQRFFHSIIRHAQITWVDYS